MKAEVTIAVIPGTLVQKSMKLFEMLESCTILDIDMKTIKNNLVSRLPHIRLRFLKHLFNPIELPKYAQEIDTVLRHFDFVDYQQTKFLAPAEEKTEPTNVLNFIEHIVTKELTKAQDAYGKALLRKAKNKKLK